MVYHLNQQEPPRPTGKCLIRTTLPRFITYAGTVRIVGACATGKTVADCGRPLHAEDVMQRTPAVFAETPPIEDLRQSVYREQPGAPLGLLRRADALNACDRLAPPDEQQATGATPRG